MFVANQMDMLVSHKEESKKVYVKYATETKLTKQMLDDIVEDLYLDENPLLTKNDTLVIISNDEPNDTLQSKVRDFFDIETTESEIERKFIIIINIQRLLFNILEHSLQPQFRVLKQDELEKVMQRYNIKNLSQFPEISRFDPVAQCLFMRPKQVCHILRDSLTAVQTSYYRVCV
jgi:DNA-directed RNA polymerase subunit H (RpoH/RPB5)